MSRTCFPLAGVRHRMAATIVTVARLIIYLPIEFWLIGGTSAHPVAVIQGMLIAGIDISFTLTSKPAAADDGEDEFPELYEFRLTMLIIPPVTIILMNVAAIAAGVFRTIYSPFPKWSKLLGGVFFSF
ncbi:hypothetical protein M8C21_001481 [Ambrosia artemisiifolia]|uniref:Uncharacterized protein n=1 Tax=Ambrosia artemisiifolia TaxID=4212 RepID=A0AAD5CY87_AMBAR|nr:hypothetical protein M8C21_001481 [Ambrosia artemisiifolia]